MRHFNYPKIPKSRLPFGSPLIGRSFEADEKLGYRFGMNTQEKDDEIYGEGNATTAEFWEYDSRLGRRWNDDQVVKAEESGYSCFSDNPNFFVDVFGDNEGDFYDETGNYLGTDGKKDGKVYVVTDEAEAKDAKKATDNGYMFSKGDLRSEVELPNAKVRERMGDAVERSNNPSEKAGDSEGGMHEEGGYYGTNAKGQAVLIDADPGSVFVRGDDMANIDTRKPGSQYNRHAEWRSKDRIEGTFHVHPKGNGTTRFVMPPSTPDHHRAESLAALSGVAGNNYILGSLNNTVYVYKVGETGLSTVIATFPLDKFISIKSK